MRPDQIHAALKLVRREVRHWQEPVVGRDVHGEVVGQHRLVIPSAF